jgi:hypothetical protein
LTKFLINIEFIVELIFCEIRKKIYVCTEATSHKRKKRSAKSQVQSRPEKIERLFELFQNDFETPNLSLLRFLQEQGSCEHSQEIEKEERRREEKVNKNDPARRGK